MNWQPTPRLLILWRKNPEATLMLNGEPHRIVMANYTRARVQPLTKIKVVVHDKLHGKDHEFMKLPGAFDISPNSELPCSL